MKLRRGSPVFFPVLLATVCFCSLAWADNAPAPALTSENTVMIPGPLRSFLRMAAISQQVSPDDVLPLLTTKVFIDGYEDGRPTEFLMLLERYLHQARELQTLAGPSGTIHVAGCADVDPLLRILGYRLWQACGQPNTSLITADPERAFLTIDSGFPLTGLEEALEKGAPFSYHYPATPVPVLWQESSWASISNWRERGSGNLVDILLHDPNVARLYHALSEDDAETALALYRSPGLRKLLPYAAILDFYGPQIMIRSGHVLVPGGQAAEGRWRNLVGASPRSPGDFVVHLLSRDHGWLAVYFDTLSRIPKAQQAHLTESPRLKQLYESLRTPDPDERAADGSFRKGGALLVLYTRLQWGPSGEPYIPGNLQVWKEVFNEKTDSKIVRKWARSARSWNTPEQLLDGLVACSRIPTDSGPLQVYLVMSELDRGRPAGERLAPSTVSLLADKFSELGNWYLLFSEFPELSGDSLTAFVTTAGAINRISNDALRGNALGMFQANIGLWQILARQREIPAVRLNTSWRSTIQPFSRISSSTQLFDAGRASLTEVIRAATGQTNISEDEIIDLLAGPPQTTTEGRRIHQEMANRIHSVLSDQRLASLDTMFALGSGLNEMAQGAAVSARLVPLAEEIQEFELPRPIFTKSEKTEWASGVYSNRHTELQVRTDLTKVIKTRASRQQLEAARGELTPFLRDTLVGLNYAYYEPPGAQILHNNPLFIRSHDFAGDTLSGPVEVWQAPQLLGVGLPAGGGAYLVGSLAELPYVLAAAEQDFIAPRSVQALIWQDLVPNLLVNATLPRWWNVTPQELHAVTLYQRTGEELLQASAGNQDLRGKVVGILSNRISPQRLAQIEDAIGRGDQAATLTLVSPGDTFNLAAEFRQEFPDEAASSGPAGRELDKLCREHPQDTSMERLSKDFGVPHPVLAESYQRQLLDVKPFPAFGGYYSGLFGESWDSGNLYWARLADEMGYPPVMLNRLIPELTRQMVARIFATDIEDWPAVLRAMRETGKDFRQGGITVEQKPSQAL